MSDTLDEIDWEWSGNDFAYSVPTIQTNYSGKGITGNWDRGTQPQVEKNMTQNFATYTIDWKPESIEWQIDGETIRTLYAKDGDNNQYQFPQTPFRFHLGVWDAGNEGVAWYTAQWAGGYTDLTKLPYSMFIKNVTITPYQSCGQYNFTDTTGSSDSVACLNNPSSSNSTAVGTGTGALPTKTEGSGGVSSTFVDPDASSPACQSDKPDFIPSAAPVPPVNYTDMDDGSGGPSGKIPSYGDDEGADDGEDEDEDEDEDDGDGYEGGFSTCSAATPENTQPGTAAGCGKYYNVKSGDTCESIAKTNGIAVDDLLDWNAQVDEMCRGLRANYAICVSAPGECDGSVETTPAPDGASMTTATIKHTSTITVFKCAPTIPNCPAKSKTVPVLETTTTEFTTVCAVSEVESISSSAAGSTVVISIGATEIPRYGTAPGFASPTEMPSEDTGSGGDENQGDYGDFDEDEDEDVPEETPAPEGEGSDEDVPEESTPPAETPDSYDEGDDEEDDVPGESTPPAETPDSYDEGDDDEEDVPADEADLDDEDEEHDEDNSDDVHTPVPPMSTTNITTIYTTVCPAEETITTSGTTITSTLSKLTTSTKTATIVTTVPISTPPPGYTSGVPISSVDIVTPPPGYTTSDCTTVYTRSARRNRRSSQAERPAFPPEPRSLLRSQLRHIKLRFPSNLRAQSRWSPALLRRLRDIPLPRSFQLMLRLAPWKVPSSRGVQRSPVPSHRN